MLINESKRRYYDVMYDLDNGDLEIINKNFKYLNGYYLIQDNIKWDDDGNFESCDYHIYFFDEDWRPSGNSNYIVFDGPQYTYKSNNDLIDTPSTAFQETIMQSDEWKWFTTACREIAKKHKKSVELKQKRDAEYEEIRRKAQQERDEREKYLQDNDGKAIWSDDRFNAHITRGEYVTSSGKVMYANEHLFTNIPDIEQHLQRDKYPFYMDLCNTRTEAENHYKEFAKNLAETAAQSRAAAKQSAVICFVGGKYQGKSCDYKYRKSTWLTKNSLINDYKIPGSYVDRFFNKYNEVLYDLVIYEHRENEIGPYDIYTCFPATMSRIKELGGYRYEGSEGLLDSDNVETLKNKLMILDKNEISCTICPITVVQYRNTKRNNGEYDSSVHLEAKVSYDGKSYIVSSGSDVNAKGSTLRKETRTNFTNQNLEDAKNSIKKEILRAYVTLVKESRGSDDVNARTNEINGYRTYWVTDLYDAQKLLDDDFSAIINYYKNLKGSYVSKEVDQLRYFGDYYIIENLQKSLRRSSNREALSSNPQIKGNRTI